MSISEARNDTRFTLIKGAIPWRAGPRPTGRVGNTLSFMGMEPMQPTVYHFENTRNLGTVEEVNESVHSEPEVSRPQIAIGGKRTSDVFGSGPLQQSTPVRPSSASIPAVPAVGQKLAGLLEVPSAHKDYGEFYPSQDGSSRCPRHRSLLHPPETSGAGPSRYKYGGGFAGISTQPEAEHSARTSPQESNEVLELGGVPSPPHPFPHTMSQECQLENSILNKLLSNIVIEGKEVIHLPIKLFLLNTLRPQDLQDHLLTCLPIPIEEEVRQEEEGPQGEDHQVLQVLQAHLVHLAHQEEFHQEEDLLGMALQACQDPQDHLDNQELQELQVNQTRGKIAIKKPILILELSLKMSFLNGMAILILLWGGLQL